MLETEIDEEATVMQIGKSKMGLLRFTVGNMVFIGRDIVLAIRVIGGTDDSSVQSHCERV